MTVNLNKLEDIETLKLYLGNLGTKCECECECEYNLVSEDRDS